MKDIKDVIAWLEEELAHFEMAVEQHNYVSKADEIRYRMAQELLAWTLGYKFDSKYSARAVNREPSLPDNEVVCITHDTKAFGRHS